jgi:hypothetical protein
MQLSAVVRVKTIVAMLLDWGRFGKKGETIRRSARRAGHAASGRRLPETDPHPLTEAEDQAATFRAEGCRTQDTLRLSG